MNARPAFSAVLTALVLSLPAVTAVSHARPPRRVPDAPKEVRGVWVVRTDLTSRRAVTRVVEHARRNGLNTLFVQCRGRGDAYYSEALEPRAEALEKAGPDFDPLAQSVEEGHAAGLQVHAWINACYVWSDRSAPESPDHLVNARPDWLAVSRSGRRCRPGDPEVFICPSNREARAHLVAVCRDVAARYDVDGIQLDYIRYPNREFCYCAGCLRRFEAYVAPRVPAAQRAALKARGRLGLADGLAWRWGQFRRDQITSLVREVRQAVKAARRDVTLSAAVIPWGPFRPDFRKTEAYNKVAQDWYGWIRSGIVDAVCPMTYQPDLPSFRNWVAGVRRHHPRFPVWFGIGAYRFGPESAATKVHAVRSLGGRGWVLFSYTAVTRHGSDDRYLRTLKARVIPVAQGAVGSGQSSVVSSAGAERE